MEYSTLLELYNEDNTILDNITLPDTYDSELFRSILILDYGKRLSMYSIDEIRAAATIWSNRYRSTFTRLYDTLTEEYNPLHNFDRYEEYTDTEDTERTNARTISNNETVNSENKISADNESAYSPDTQGTMSTTDSGSVGDSGTENRGLEHSGHLYGNIGVTKSQDMALDEIDLRSKYNIYSVPCDLFEKDFLLGLSKE